MHLSLNDALKYATKVRASAADYHKAFDRLAADPKAEEGANEKALVPTEFFADHLRSEGHHPQADLIQQAMTHSKEQGEPVVYSEQIAQFPPHHREILEGLGQGDFHLVLGKPNSHHTAAVLYQRSHTDPSKVFGWTDSIEGTPDEVKAEVDRFQRAGVPVELAIGPQHKDYDKWAKHFGLSGYSEESEQYAAVKYGLETVDSFHNAIIANPAEATTALVFADHLDDKGHPSKAKIIRGHATTHNNSGAVVANNSGSAFNSIDSEVIATGPYEDEEGGQRQINLMLRELNKERSHLLVWNHALPEEEAKAAYNDLRKAGSVSLDFTDGPDLEEPEQHSTLEQALKYVQETHADFHNRMWDERGDTTVPLVYADWLQEEQGKEGLAAVVRKHVEEQGGGPEFLTKGRKHFWPLTGIDRLFDTDDHPTTFHYSPTEGLTLQQHSAHQPDRTVVWKVKPSEEAEALTKKLHSEGSVPVDMPEGWEPHKDPVLKSVNPTYGEPADPVSEHFSAADKPLRYSAVPDHEIHEDYAPNGSAPRIGHTLKQLAQEDSTTGALAEGILRTGDHSILPILADRLEETEHPLASAFDWRHAPRAIRIDRALHRQINSRQVRHPDGHRVPLTAGWVLADMQDGVQRPAFSRRKALLAARLAVPDATTEDLLHSLFRLMDHREVADTAPELVQPVADHTKALTAARLQKLRQRAGNPYQYADTRQPNKQVYSAEKVRYSHEAFQKALAKDPNDHTASAIYAEWLDDQNLPTHAEVVRRVAEAQRQGGGYLNGGHQWLAGNVAWGSKGDFAIGVNVPYGMADKPEWTLDLASRHLHEAPSGTTQVKPIFTLLGLHRDEVKRLVDGLDTEGADMGELEAPHASPDHKAILAEVRAERARKLEADQPEPTYADTKKYGSWRAPAGGMVVQQSPLAVSGQWAEGGEFVNDLQKLAPQPVEYKKKKRLTVEYLRQHFRKRRKAKVVAGARVIDDTAGEGDAGAEAGAE